MSTAALLISKIFVVKIDILICNWNIAFHEIDIKETQSNGIHEVHLFNTEFPTGGTWVNLCWVCAAGLSEPLPHYSHILWPIIDPILVTSG